MNTPLNVPIYDWSTGNATCAMRHPRTGEFVLYIFRNTFSGAVRIALSQLRELESRAAECPRT